MANAGNDIRILTVAGDPASWTLVSAPADIRLRRFTVRNSQAVDAYLRGDNTDPTTQDTIPANYERTFEMTRQAARTGLFYWQPASGTGPLKVVCTT